MTRAPIGSCVRWRGLVSVWMSAPTPGTVRLDAAAAHRLWWGNFTGVAGKAALCHILIVSGWSCLQWALGNLADTIYPKFCSTPQHIDVCPFFVLCPAKVCRSCEDSPCEFKTGRCSYIKMLYSCVCSVATGYYFTKPPKKNLHLGSSFCGVLVGKSTQRSARVEKRLLYSLKQSTNRR